MLRLALAGPHTQILSPLCARCPHAPAGCCVGPPPLDWSDIGRIVALGGRDWILGAIAERRLSPDPRGLAIAREKGVASPGGPRVLKCTFHDRDGCTIPPDRRSATCNYYVCDSVLADPDAKEAAPSAWQAKNDLAKRFEAWDAVLAREIAARYPASEGGVVYDAALLDWLGERFARLAGLSSDAAPERPAP